MGRILTRGAGTHGLYSDNQPRSHKEDQVFCHPHPSLFVRARPSRRPMLSLMDSPATSSFLTKPEANSVKKFIWHSKDVAHVEAKIFELCKGDFGIPKQHYSTPLKDSNDVPISNALFLPPPGARLEDYYWDITGESGPPPTPDHRELWFHMTNSGANGLSDAWTPLELCTVIGHSMLGTRWFPRTTFRLTSDTYPQDGCRCYTRAFCTGILEWLECSFYPTRSR